MPGVTRLVGREALGHRAAQDMDQHGVGLGAGDAIDFGRVVARMPVRKKEVRQRCRGVGWGRRRLVEQAEQALAVAKGHRPAGHVRQLRVRHQVVIVARDEHRLVGTPVLQRLEAEEGAGGDLRGERRHGQNGNRRDDRPSPVSGRFILSTHGPFSHVLQGCDNRPGLTAASATPIRAAGHAPPPECSSSVRER